MTTYWAAFICGWKHRNKHMVPATRFVRTTNIEQDQNPWLWGEGEDLNPQNSSGSDCESMRDHMCVLRESGKNSVEREGLDGDTPPIMLWCCYHGKVLRDNFLCTLPPVCVFFLSFVFFFSLPPHIAYFDTSSLSSPAVVPVLPTLTSQPLLGAIWGHTDLRVGITADMYSIIICSHRTISSIYQHSHMFATWKHREIRYMIWRAKKVLTLRTCEHIIYNVKCIQYI